VAEAAGVPRLVLSHMGPTFEPARNIELIKADYRGEVVVGTDLQRV
jgi:hypothetical protein